MQSLWATSEFGPVIPVLPWRDPAGALSWLEKGDQAKVASGAALLAGAFMSDEGPLNAMILGLRELIPDANFAVYPGAASALFPWFVHDCHGSIEKRAVAVRNTMPLRRLYSVDRVDPLGNRPVNLSTLGAMHPSVVRAEDTIAGILNDLLHPIGWHHQLRTVLYEQGRIALFAGAYRSTSGAAFSLREHALLHALEPSMRCWAALLTLLGRETVGFGSLAITLDAIAQPAMLLHDGEVVFANAIARDNALTEWRMGIEAEKMRPSRLESTRQHTKFSTVSRETPIVSGGIRMRLVVGPFHRSGSPSGESTLAPKLPPSLQKVHVLLSRGLADKEIAAELGLSLSTARTYSARVRALVGVSNRRQLMTSSRSKP